jgi:nucleoside 2-deoxyribosyltransferase
MVGSTVIGLLYKCRSHDGRLISIASHDGYISFFQFTDGELGEETTPPLIAEFKPVPLLANNSFVNRAGRRAKKDVQKKVMELKEKEMDTSDTPVANFTPVPAEQTITAFFAKSKTTTPSRKDQENEPKPKAKRRIVPTALPPVAQ